MRTSLPLLLVWTGADPYVFSPTQIDSFLLCQRKWAWRRIAKVETPAGPSAALGTRVHSVLEQYLGEGKRPDFVTDRQAAEIASSGLHLLPAPKTEGMLLEQHFQFKSVHTGFVYHGFKDVQLRPGIPTPMGFDGSAPIVIDHKTTKSINSWAKTEEDLQYDAQAVIYGLDAMARYASDVVDLGWGYLQTEGAKRASPTTTRLHAEHALKVFDQIERAAEEAANALEKGLQPVDLPPNPAACRAFGGCPYESLCNLSPAQKARSRMSNSLIANLRARVQGAATVVVPPTPSVMGCADTDVPAPTEIPAAFLAPINPPESELAPPVHAVEEAAKTEKPKRTRRTKEQIAADEAVLSTGVAAVLEPADVELAHDASKDDKPATVPLVVVEEEAPKGFTLYVDCIPIGKAAKAASGLIAAAQERIAKELGAADYRLIDFGKGVPAFIAFVDEQVDGSFDLALDTRTPEGAILLETLSAKASFVVRGFR